MEVSEAWKALTAAARAYAAAEHQVTQQALADAAIEYAKARWSRSAGVKRQVEQATTKREVSAPFGRHKGKPLSEVPDADLQWLRDRVEDSLADAERARWRQQNRDLLVAIEAELTRRGAT